MKSPFVGTMLFGAVIGMIVSQAFAIEEIPEKRMVSRGGVLYPETGDASQELFQTPENARQLFPPGTLVGVLPADCLSASQGSIGNYYRCDHNFALQEVLLQDSRTVYRVIETP